MWTSSSNSLQIALKLSDLKPACGCADRQILHKSCLHIFPDAHLQLSEIRTRLLGHDEQHVHPDQLAYCPSVRVQLVAANRYPLLQPVSPQTLEALHALFVILYICNEQPRISETVSKLHI